MTRDALVSEYSRLYAFQGLDTGYIDLVVDMALEAVSAYIPKRVILRGIPVESGENGRYLAPANAETVLQAFVSGTCVDIRLDEELSPEGGKYYVLERVSLFSFSSFDLEYTVPLMVEDLSVTELTALRYYAESEAYQKKGSDKENLVDISLRTAAGAVAHIGSGSRGMHFRELARERSDLFLREVSQPYFTIDTYSPIFIPYGFPRPEEVISVPRHFDWTMERDFSVLRGSNAITAVIGWKQGEPFIEGLDITDISVQFFADEEQTDRILPSDPRWMIGNEGLNEIITLESFVDNGDGTGSVVVMIDPSDITAQELMMSKTIYFLLAVSETT